MNQMLFYFATGFQYASDHITNLSNCEANGGDFVFLASPHCRFHEICNHIVVEIEF